MGPTITPIKSGAIGKLRFIMPPAQPTTPRSAAPASPAPLILRKSRRLIPQAGRDNAALTVLDFSVSTGNLTFLCFIIPLPIVLTLRNVDLPLLFSLLLFIILARAELD